MFTTDETQLKTVHAAKCLNDQCNNPVQIPWKENLQLVRKPDENIRDEHNDDITAINDVADEIIHCSECGTKFTEQHIEKFKKVMEFTELHVQNMENALVSYVDVCKYCLDRQEGVLHPKNVMYAQTLDHAFDALIQVRLWDQAIKYADSLISCFRFYYGEWHPLVGLLYLKYGKILLYQMNSRKALEELKKSEKILKVTHGNRHPLYTQELLPLLQQAVVEGN